MLTAIVFTIVACHYCREGCCGHADGQGRWSMWAVALAYMVHAAEYALRAH
ncbi:hypothetical protein ACVFYP_20975 [Roseomonas sp. F4]